MDRPNTPAPRTVTSALAKPQPPDPSSRPMRVDLGQTADGGKAAEPLWRNGVPVSPRFDDPYYSLSGGLAEARYVFLDGNGLPGRFRPGFRIAELGFGTGLNMLAAWDAWRGSNCPGPLRFTSFEAWPMSAGAMARALAAFPEISELASVLIDAWERGRTSVSTAEIDAVVVLGDAREILPAWDGIADAWFLDGFAPSRNPEMWEPALLREVARRTAPGGGFATYAAAGNVRRALAEAGFSVERRPGFGRKRHMSAGTLERGS